MCSHSFKIRRLSLLPAVTDTESLLSQAFIGRSFTWGRGVLTFYLHITPGSSAGKRICLQCRRPQFDSWVGKFPWRRDRLPTPVFLGFPGGSDGLKKKAQMQSNNFNTYGCILSLSSIRWETWLPSLCWEDPLEEG